MTTSAPEPRSGPETPTLAAMDPLRVFLSSVLDESTLEARQASIRVLSRGPFRAWAWEAMPASSDGPRDAYLEGVNNAHVLVWLVTDRTSDAVIDEVGRGLERRIPILAFRLPSSGPEAPTTSLLGRVRAVAKTKDVTGVADLEAQLEAALTDLLIRRFLTGSDHERGLRYALNFHAGLRGRAIARWLAVGVPLERAEEMVADDAVGALPVAIEPDQVAPLRVVVGDFGGGKTLAAIRFLMAAARRLFTDPVAPLPLWISPETTIEDLDAVVSAQTSQAGDFRTRGVAIVVNAIDERANDSPAAVLERVRALVHSHPSSTGLITCRPGIYAPRDVPEVRVLDPLSLEASAQLINRVFATHMTEFGIQQWDKPLRDAVRLPMFALLVGHLRVRDPHRRITGVGQLIEELVTTSLGRESDRLSTNQLLMHLARESIDAGGVPVPQSSVGDRLAVREAINTRLVVPVGRGLTFALAILREWFGAQSLGAGLTSIDHVTSDEQQLERWRYALYVAAGTLSPALVDQLLERLARVSPGVVSDVISEAGARWGTDDQDQAAAARPLDLGRAYLKSVRALSDGIGDAGHLMFPWLDRDTLAKLRVAVRDRHAIFDWRVPRPGEDSEPVEIDFDGVFPTREPGRLRTSYFGVASDPLWPWSHARDDLRDALMANLSARSLYVVSMLPEATWLAATWVTRRGHRCDPIPTEEVRQALRSQNPFGWIEVRKKRVPLGPLFKAIEGVESLRCPYPDRDEPIEGSAWEGFSDEVIVERTRIVYTAALSIYEDLVRYYFQGFRERLEHAVLLPARLVATVHPKTDQTRGPTVTYHFEPLPPHGRTEVAITISPETTGSWDRLDALAPLVPKRRPQAPWVQASVHSGGLDIRDHDPATKIAEDWLLRDLKAIGWAK